MPENIVGAGGGSFDDQQNPLDIGESASATGTDSIALSARAQDGGNNNAIAIGPDAQANGKDSIAIGNNTTASRQGIAIGIKPTATSRGDVAIGYNVDAYRSVSIGKNIPALDGEYGDNLVINYGSLSIDKRTQYSLIVGLGNNEIQTAGTELLTNFLFIRGGDITTNSGDTEDVIAIGQNVDSYGRRTIVMGRDAKVGSNAGDADKAVSIGYSTSVLGESSVALGSGAVVNNNSVARIGTDQLIFGGTRDQAPDSALENGELLVEMDETNNAFRLRGKDSGGTVREATVAW